MDDCLQGNGTAAENLAYENCQKQCLAEASMTSASTAAPTMTGSSAAASASGGAQTTGTTGTSAGGKKHIALLLRAELS